MKSMMIDELFYLRCGHHVNHTRHPTPDLSGKPAYLRYDPDLPHDRHHQHQHTGHGGRPGQGGVARPVRGAEEEKL